MECSHYCKRCGWSWDCAFPYYEKNTLSEAQDEGFACNDICSYCEPTEYNWRIEQIQAERDANHEKEKIPFGTQTNKMIFGEPPNQYWRLQHLCEKLGIRFRTEDCSMISIEHLIYFVVQAKGFI